MIKKGNMLYSILKMKCPQCHEGDFFLSSVYDFKNMGKIHENCSSCGCKYSKEPGFYYGAMYVSYGLSVGILVAAFVLTYLLYPSASPMIYIATLLFALVVSAPYVFALSKIIWANMFIKYQGNK